MQNVKYYGRTAAFCMYYLMKKTPTTCVEYGGVTVRAFVAWNGAAKRF